MALVKFIQGIAQEETRERRGRADHRDRKQKVERRVFSQKTEHKSGRRLVVFLFRAPRSALPRVREHPARNARASPPRPTRVSFACVLVARLASDPEPLLGTWRRSLKWHQTSFEPVQCRWPAGDRRSQVTSNVKPEPVVWSAKEAVPRVYRLPF